MSAALRSGIGLLILTLLLVACTRERPIPELLPALDDSPAAQTPGDGETPAGTTTGEEPQVTDGSAQSSPSTTQGGVNLDDPLGLSEEPDVVVPGETPSPDSQGNESFTYSVRPGDTLTGLAQRFETDIATLRRLNALDSDVLSVGQLLVIPYIEGMTADGAPTPTPGPFFYTVQAGDTLSAIAARFNADPIRLAESNSLLDPNNLIVGSQILIPGYEAPAQAGGTNGGTSTTPSGEARFVHIVQPGEGLMEIASRYGIDMNTIATANNLVNRNVLRVGQELVIPGITARDAAVRSGAVHIVQSGESLLGIALRYGVTMEEIMEFNQITNPNAIIIGQQLIIPRN